VQGHSTNAAGTYTMPITKTGGKQQPQPSSSSKGGTGICHASKGAGKDGNGYYGQVITTAAQWSAVIKQDC
jgi:hypothetical protein